MIFMTVFASDGVLDDVGDVLNYGLHVNYSIFQFATFDRTFVFGIYTVAVEVLLSADGRNESE